MSSKPWEDSKPQYTSAINPFANVKINSINNQIPSQSIQLPQYLLDQIDNIEATLKNLSKRQEETERQNRAIIDLLQKLTNQTPNTDVV